MFEEIVESKFRQLKEITNKIKLVSFEEIKKSNLPNFAINFLCTELPEISDKNTLETYLEKSVKLIVNYTLRPKWTLLNYLFGGYDSKPADEILKKVEVFGFYMYYVDLITNHIKDNSLMFITQEDVKSLTDEANKAVLDKLIKDTSSIKIKNFFSQIYKLKYGDDREVNLDWSVPFLFIKLFLEDKEYQSIADKFKIIPGLDDSMEIEMKTAIKILTNKYYVNNDFFVLKDEPQNVESEASIVKNETVAKTSEQKTKEKIEKPGMVDLTEEIKTKPFAEKEPAVEKEIKTEDEEDKPKGIIRIIKNIPTKRFHRGKKYEDERIKEIKEEPVPAIKEEPVPEIKEEKKINEGIERTEKIKHLFKQDERNTILKKVFKDSRSAMYEAFDDLEKFDSWQDASAYLKDIFLKNKVDLYNKRVVLFIDILQDHFFTNRER